MKVLRFTSIFVVLFVIMSVVFGISNQAIEYYSAAELSYKAGDYATALRNYELALSVDSTIEGYDSQLKFKMGISAYMIGDYDKAKSYLSGYHNDFVNALLESIAQRKAQDEWKKWIAKNRPTTSEVSEVPAQVPETQTKNNYFLITFLIFVITFSVLIFAELRIYRLRKVVELPVRPESQPVEQPIVVEAGEMEEAVISEELQLLPKDAKVIDFESLMNSEIDVFKDILEQIQSQNVSSTGSEKGREPMIYDEQAELDKDVETTDEREKLIHEILDESRELVESIEKEESVKEESVDDILNKEKRISEEHVDLESQEMLLLERLKEISEKLEEQKNLTVEEFESIQKDFEEFDEIEKITEDETKIFVRKLLELHRGGNN
ncbi:MAG: tetratricopeptide repeat protein [Fervidobacterium sp.]|uniref:tetratricopeptide repeat protein n=1 Tax=Fervidobacterium sp. TaxID=1871331 RepID=UPI0040495885